MTTHLCPVCGKSHAVHPARHAVAWGRQLSCSCACEQERRRIRKRRFETYIQGAQEKCFKYTVPMPVFGQDMRSVFITCRALPEAEVMADD